MTGPPTAGPTAGAATGSAAGATRPVAAGAGPTTAEVRGLLTGVIDPEVGINIVDLGLVYEVTVDEERIAVLMTMTTPACPLGPYIEQSVDLALADVADGRAVEVEITFDPPWTPDMISTEGRRELGWPA